MPDHGQFRTAAAMLEGSAEAFHTITHFQGQGRETIEQEIKRLLAEANRIQEEQGRTGKEALAAFLRVENKLGVRGF